MAKFCVVCELKACSDNPRQNSNNYVHKEDSERFQAPLEYSITTLDLTDKKAALINS